MATTTEQDKVRELQRTLYRAAKADPHGDGRMPAVKNVGEPCAGEPHARFEVAAGGNRNQSATPRGTGASRRPYMLSGGWPCRRLVPEFDQGRVWRDAPGALAVGGHAQTPSCSRVG